MKVVVCLNPVIYHRIRVIQNEKVIYAGKLQNEIDLPDISDGKVTIALGRKSHPFYMEADNIDVDVKFDSVVFIGNTGQVIRMRTVMCALWLLLVGIACILPDNLYAVLIWLVAVLALVCYSVAMSARYHKHIDKQYMVYVK